MNVHFSSKKDEWETPEPLFKLLDDEFHFDLDVCASWDNKKCAEYFDVDENGLEQDWSSHTCWMNPPYGNAIGNWVRKALSEAEKGTLVACLVPARTDTQWWWDTCARAAEIRFLKGRVTFVGADANAPFPSAIVIFDRTPSQSGDLERRPLMVSWWDWRAEIGWQRGEGWKSD